MAASTRLNLNFNNIYTRLRADFPLPPLLSVIDNDRGNQKLIDRLMQQAFIRSHKDTSLRLGLSLTLASLALLLGSGILVLLVLGHQVVHVRLGLGEFHLIHTLSGVPMEKGLATEHGGELLANALEELLDGSAVTNEGGRHLETTRGDVANSGLDVVRDPLNKVRAVLVLDVEHLLVDLLH